MSRSTYSRAVLEVPPGGPARPTVDSASCSSSKPWCRLVKAPVKPADANEAVAYPASRNTSAMVVAEAGSRSGIWWTPWVVG